MSIRDYLRVLRKDGAESSVIRPAVVERAKRLVEGLKVYNQTGGSDSLWHGVDAG
jgi:hypothetical protein